MVVDNAKVLHHLVLYTLPQGAEPYSSTPIPCNMIVFAQFNLMHYVGRRLWTEQYRQGKLIGNLALHHCDFNNQYVTMINETIMPGDELLTHCVYHLGL